MKRKYIIVITFHLLLSNSIVAQPNKRTNFWYFGDHVGLEFNSGHPIEDPNSLVMNAVQEGSAVMSDTNGNLLFYSDGKWVWDRNHYTMKNEIGYPNIPSTYQSSIALKKPSSENIYYIFLTSSCYNPDRLPLIYYTIDMSLEGGLGEIIGVDTIIMLYDVAEKLTATYHKNKHDIWLVSRRYFEDAFASILITSDGPDPIPILSPAPNRELFWERANEGPMKISYDKKYLISVFEGGEHHTGGFVEICKFDNQLGTVDFLYDFQLKNAIYPNSVSYEESSCEFSPCSKYLYVAGEEQQQKFVHIYQFDIQFILDSIAFKQSAIKVGEVQGSNLQLASDGKIYCLGKAAFIYQYNPASNYIGVINHPGKLGLSCNYDSNLMYINNGQITYSIVNFFNDYLHRFDFDGICESDTFSFDPWFFPEPTYIEWNFGDPLSGANNTSTIPHASHKFTDGGTYEVSVYVEYPSGRIEETSREVEVEYAPEPDLGPDTSICAQSEIILNAECGPHFYNWSTGAFGSSQITVSDTGWYWVRVVNDAGCFEIDSIHLSLYPAAMADTANLEIIPTTCGGSTGVIKGLSISGLPPLSFQWLDDLGNPVSTSLDIYHLPVGNYTLEVTDSNDCISSFGPYSIVDAGDVLIESVQYSQEHCGQQDASITVNAISGLSDMLFYSIDNGASYFTNQGIFTGLASGNYAVRVQDSSGCESVYINNPLLIENMDAPEITGLQIGACAQGQSNGSIEITALGGGDTLFYSNDNGVVFQVNDGGFYNLLAGFYSCVVMDEAGCDTTFIVEVPEEITIRLQAVAGDDEVCPGNAAFVSLMVSNFNDVAYLKTTLLYNKYLLTCSGFANAHALLEDSLEALLFPAEGKIELNWSSNAVSLPDNSIMADLVFESLGQGTPLIEWDGAAGAYLFQNSTGLTIPVDYFTGNVRIYDEVSIFLSSSEEICQGESLEIEPWILSSNGDESYLWTYPNGNTSTNEILTLYNAQESQSGTYALRVTDTMDCYSDDSVSVLIHPTPIPAFAAEDTISTEEPIELDAGSGFDSYLWNTGENDQSITAEYEDWYKVMIESQYGCFGEDSVYVLFISAPPPPEPANDHFHIPNAFTPNGDGLNDEFKLISNSDNITAFKMYIFNRWGQMVFESNDIPNGWDGKIKGEDAPAGTYVYRIKYTVGIFKFDDSGALVLVR